MFYNKINKEVFMTICIFPGTFNPIHEGHVKMAEFALEKYKFEKIIFIPAFIPPHKNIELDLANHRFNMVKLAINYNPRFEISDIEYKSDKTSYSLITVKKIIEQYNLKDKLNFIIGTDTLINLNSWYKADELKRLVHFIVFPRKGSNENTLIFDKLKNQDWDFEITNMDYVDVSSTEIRKNKVQDKVNNQVKDYINDNQLY